MKKLKKIVIGMFFISLLMFLFRGWIFRTTVQYNQIGEREWIELTDTELISELEHYENLSFDEIKETAEDITNKKLKFSFGKVSSNSNQVLKNGKANCIGYSALFNSIVKFLINKQGLDDKIISKHLIGKIDVLGMDLHQISDNPFFKDHDFNMIEDLETGETIYFDPSVSDVLMIKSITFKK